MSEHVCEFIVPVSAFQFSTQTNGDKIILSNLTLDQEQATNLAWLINLPATAKLRVEIKQAE